MDITQALTPEVFSKIKAIQLHTQRLVTSLFAGEYESAFKGRGMEFEEVREYQAGDDIRHIDWKVTARVGNPFVKVHREERELTVMLLVDVSSSFAFGSFRKQKMDIAAEVAAILAYAAVKSNDRVGLIIFSDRIEHYVPPKKGRGHVWQVVRDVLTFKAEERATDIGLALDYLNRVVRRRSIVFVISDFIDRGFEDRLKIAARRHDVTAVTIADERELELPAMGIVQFEDTETGECITVDTHNANVRRDFAGRVRASKNLRAELLRQSAVGQIDIQTNLPFIDTIVRFFRSRERSRFAPQVSQEASQ